MLKNINIITIFMAMIIVISPLSATNTEDDKSSVMEEYKSLAASFTQDEDEVKETIFYRCKHVKSETLKRVIENFLTPSGTVSDSDEADLIIISDCKKNIPILKKISSEVDKYVPQVLVEAKIVEFTVDKQFEKEINLEFQSFRNLDKISSLSSSSKNFVNTLTSSFINGYPNNTRGSAAFMHYDPVNQNLFSMFLKFLETRGKAKILSAPNLILQRNKEGSIVTGEEVPIQTQTVTSGSVSTSTKFKSVGIKLRVRPIMISGNKVRLEVRPEVSNVTRVDSSGAPIIAVRSADTTLEIIDGQMISIGGLLRNEERETHRRVPILSSIPILGNLFRGTETKSVKSQLVIFLSIKIINENDNMSDIKTDNNSKEFSKASKEIEKIIQQQSNLKKTGLKHDLKLFLNDGNDNKKKD